MDTDAELEDELPTPEDSPLSDNSSLEEARPPGVCPPIRELVDLELEKALLCVSFLLDMVTPVEEPVEGFPMAPSSLSLTTGSCDTDASSRSSPIRMVSVGQEMDVFESYVFSSFISVYEPATSSGYAILVGGCCVPTTA